MSPLKNNESAASTARLVAHYRDDPVAFVMNMFPWGEKGSKLEHYKGPRKWQLEVLESLRDDLQKRDVSLLRKLGRGIRAIKYSIVSGHASGKSALLSWIALWLFETRPFSAGSMTSTTSQQMRGRFFRELGIWRGMMKTAHLSRITLGQTPRLVRIGAENEWKLEGYAPKKELSEAFAGQHSADSASYYIFDEASGVDDEFYRVCQGGLMDSEPFVFACGNGTRASGFFYRSHHQKESDDDSDKGWKTFSVNSMNVEGVNLDEIESMLEEFGPQSDTARVRIYGQFPNRADHQFFSTDIIDYSMTIPDIPQNDYSPIIMGVDVAWSGNDKSVICIRKGRNARDPVGDMSWYAVDTNTTDQLASRIAHICATLARNGTPVYKVCIEAIGVSTGVFDRLKVLDVPGVVPIFPSKPATPGSGAYNLRAEMYLNLRKAMEEGLALPTIQHPVVKESLRNDLLGINGFPREDSTLLMESKKDMKRRGRDSSDFSDALALTFAIPIFTHDNPYGVDWERKKMHDRNQLRRPNRDIRDFMKQRN